MKAHSHNDLSLEVVTVVGVAAGPGEEEEGTCSTTPTACTDSKAWKDDSELEVMLKVMRASRMASLYPPKHPSCQSQCQSTLDVDLMGLMGSSLRWNDTTMTESTVSCSLSLSSSHHHHNNDYNNNSASFLSWASASTSTFWSPEDDVSGDGIPNKEGQYWRDLRRGVAPTPRSTTRTRNTGAGTRTPTSPATAATSNSNLSFPDLLYTMAPKFQHSTSSVGGFHQHGNSNTTGGTKWGKFEESALLYQYSREDLEQLALDDREFTKLQKCLRKEGVVTNEFLKQVLPHVVWQSTQRRAARAAKKLKQQQQPSSLSSSLHQNQQNSDESLSLILEMEPEHGARRDVNKTFNTQKIQAVP